jgi:alpha,alpha-trehalose-phosphate synthase [UDP-forming]
MRLIALSNRLPIAVRKEAGRWKVSPGSGGLVTAMAPVLKNRGGLWIGWPGTEVRPGLANVITSSSKGTGYTLIPVSLNRREVADYYDGFSNQVAWPLFHEFPAFCKFSPPFWYSYLLVNRKFAHTVATQSTEEDYIWVHDYHLIGVGHALREMRIQRRTGFFLHIPFPAMDTFIKLPWRAQLLQFFMDYDLVGFQTMRDRRNFLECLQHLLPDVRTSGRGSVITVHHGDRSVRVGAFPISIDYEGFLRRAQAGEVDAGHQDIKARFRGRTIMLGLDRMDYTKGLEERLNAFRDALTRYPELRNRLTLIQVLVPSRRSLPEYKNIRARTDQLIGEINGQFARMDWTPIQYHYRSLSNEELLSYYRAADIALVTPLKDGMNLVAKEYCACNVSGDGVLILSEFAGAASQLHRWALMVNPYDREGTADAIHQAFTMEHSEKRRRMRKLRDSVRRQNIFRWVDSFLEAGIARHLRDFPSMEEYIPDLAMEE